MLAFTKCTNTSSQCSGAGVFSTFVEGSSAPSTCLEGYIQVDSVSASTQQYVAVTGFANIANGTGEILQMPGVVGSEFKTIIPVVLVQFAQRS